MRELCLIIIRKRLALRARLEARSPARKGGGVGNAGESLSYYCPMARSRTMMHGAGTPRIRWSTHLSAQGIFELLQCALFQGLKRDTHSIHTHCEPPRPPALPAEMTGSPD